MVHARKSGRSVPKTKTDRPTCGPIRSKIGSTAFKTRPAVVAARPARCWGAGELANGGGQVDVKGDSVRSVLDQDWGVERAVVRAVGCVAGKRVG